MVAVETALDRLVQLLDVGDDVVQLIREHRAGHLEVLLRPLQQAAQALSQILDLVHRQHVPELVRAPPEEHQRGRDADRKQREQGNKGQKEAPSHWLL